MTSPLVALLLLTAVIVLWVAVDAAWRRSVPVGGDAEALAGRLSCGGCAGGGCTNSCGREPGAGPDAGKETR